MFRLLLSSVKSIGRYRVLSHALVTNTVFGVVLRGIGDVIQQSIERKQTSEKLKKKLPKIMRMNYRMESFNYKSKLSHSMGLGQVCHL